MNGDLTLFLLLLTDNRGQTQRAHILEDFCHKRKTLLLLNCKSWLCPPWWKPIASLCLYSCLREDFCLCAFRPLQTFITGSGPKIQTIPRHSCIFATVFFHNLTPQMNKSHSSVHLLWFLSSHWMISFISTPLCLAKTSEEECNGIYNRYRCFQMVATTFGKKWINLCSFQADLLLMNTPCDLSC